MAIHISDLEVTKIRMWAMDLVASNHIGTIGGKFEQTFAGKIAKADAICQWVLNRDLPSDSPKPSPGHP